jgi:hypothetical protein
MCLACDKEFDIETYKKSKFCPICGKYLQVTEVGGPVPPSIKEMWNTYLTSQIEVSPGFFFPSAKEWVKRRKAVYKVYREKFSPANLNHLEGVKENFGSWLLFSNNLSWTTLQRTATQALENPKQLSNLLLNLQNEKVEVASRIRNSLQGSDKIRGIGQGIVTALLHTFYDNKYGVWNSRTIDTLRIFNQPTFPSDDLGATYTRVNATLIRLTKELDTDLTTLDGFMWFVSKSEE